MDKKTLAQLRAEQNMSQRELAKKLGVSSATVGMYETGKRNPSLKRAMEIAKIFNTSVEAISFSNTNQILELQTVHTKRESQNVQLSLFENNSDHMADYVAIGNYR
ncbi:MAG: helix-turn-helix transcriptional regulator [Lachnospiraceae bacterium]